MMEVAGIVVAASYVAKGAVDVGRSAVVDYSGDGGCRGGNNKDCGECQCADEIELVLMCC